MMYLTILLSLFTVAWAEPEEGTEPTTTDGTETPAPVEEADDGEDAPSEEASDEAEEQTPEALANELCKTDADCASDQQCTADGICVGVGDVKDEDMFRSDSSAEEEDPPPDLSTSELEDAEIAPKVDKKFFEFLKPTREKLAQNPYGNTEYTAYALEFGQFRMGVNQSAMGIAPRVQLGTAPALDLLGIYNASLKINALRTGRLDMAAQGSYYTLDAGLDAEWIRAGILGSIRVIEPWSMHLGFSYDRVAIGGLPEPSKVSDLLIEGSSDDLMAWEQAAKDQGVSLELEQAMVTMRMATDYRFNRRDALVLQGSAILWSSAQSGINGLDPSIEEGLSELPPILGIDGILQDESNLSTSVLSSYVLSLAYQQSRKHLDLRIGLGVSSFPYAWLLQTFELSYHFGGKTRREESQLKKDWRRNKRIDGQ
jgi:hypothetical protein